MKNSQKSNPQKKNHLQKNLKVAIKTRAMNGFLHPCAELQSLAKPRTSYCQFFIVAQIF